jgi:hypothetical protein
MSSRHQNAIAALGALGLAVVVSGTPVMAESPAGEPVKVERIKTKKEKHETLRFLKANLDFIRSEIDRLRESAVDRDDEAVALDPRFLALQDMLSQIIAARDSIASESEEVKAREFLASVTELGELEGQLDLMESLLEEQTGRLARLQEDFTGRQRTALMVLVTGWPATGSLSPIQLIEEDGSTTTIELTSAQRTSLEQGGLAEIYYEFVEPREQVLEIRLGSGDPAASAPGYITLDPERDRITFLELDLGGLTAGSGVDGLAASRWVADESVLTGDAFVWSVSESPALGDGGAAR